MNSGQLTQASSFSLLCQCLRSVSSEERPCIMKELQDARPEWPEIIGLADRHFVLPALYNRLNRSGLLEMLPEEHSNVLEQIYTLNKQRNALIRDEINMIACSLNKEGIQPLFLKGAAALLVNLYEDSGLRMMNDVDFLVRKKDIAACMELMQHAGYYPMDVPGLKEDYFEKLYHERPLVNDRHNVRFEVHRQLHQNPVIDSEELIASARPVTLEDGVALVPDANHFVMHNILHHQLFNGCLDSGDTPLYQLLDLYAVRERCDRAVNWNQLERFFLNPSLRDAFHNALDLLDKYFGQQPPVTIPYHLPLRIQYRRFRVRLTERKRCKKQKP